MKESEIIMAFKRLDKLSKEVDALSKLSEQLFFTTMKIKNDIHNMSSIMSEMHGFKKAVERVKAKVEEAEKAQEELKKEKGKNEVE